MIEKTVRDYLAAKLSVPVLMEEPEKPAKSWVRIEKTGSGRKDWINEATLAVQSYASSLFEAAALNEEVKSAMTDVIALDDVCRCDLNSDYNFTDPKTHRYRYQAVFEIKHY